jgi:hypothetical protein
MLGHGFVLNALGTLQNDARTQRQDLRVLAPTRSRLQLLPARITQYQFRLWRTPVGSTSHQLHYSPDSREEV